MYRSTRAALRLLAAFLFAACAESTLPEQDRSVLPEPDRSIDPATLVIGAYIATPCGGNEDLRKRGVRVLVDIFFGRKSNNDRADRPQEEHIHAVNAFGGVVLHRFNVPAVRARINLNHIPDLLASAHWVTVREVPNPARYDLEVNVGYARPIGESDLQQFRKLGGRVSHRFDFINGISGAIPDHSIPELRASPGVLYVETNGIFCVGG